MAVIRAPPGFGTAVREHRLDPRAHQEACAKPRGRVQSDIMVRRATAWLACVEGAISGQAGHNRTFRVACKLTHPFPQGFGPSFDHVRPLIKEWNEQCEPPLSDAELTHKLVDAAGKIR